MKTSIGSFDSYASIPPSGVHAYLTNRGWKKLGAYADKGDIYQLADYPEIIAPANSDFRDYALRVSEIVDILGRVEERHSNSIVRDLNTATTDLIRIRAPEAEEDGSIVLEKAVRFVEESRNLLLASACSAHKPKRSYPRPNRIAEAVDYLSDVRMGQTERGSYVVTLLSPVQPSLLIYTNEGSADGVQEANEHDAYEPFARRVTHRFAEALMATKEAVTLCTRGGEFSEFESRVGSGTNANFCSALAGLIDNGEGVDLSISWALTRAPSPQVRNTPTIRFSQNDAAFLKEATRLFRSKEDLPDETITGVVTRLARDATATQGTVTVQATIDGVQQSVKVDVGVEHYEQITKAHHDRDVVVIEGDVERQGQRWKIPRPTNIQVFSDMGDE